MGTNFYLHSKECATCGRADPPLHIGKRSGGYVFLLHVSDPRWLDDEPVPTSLAAWATLLVSAAEEGSTIRDEYGTCYTPAAMLAIVNEPTGRHRTPSDFAWCAGENVCDYGVGEFL